MSSFTENTSIQPLPSTNTWVTVKPFTYYLYEKDGESVTVPSGFEFDGASIPNIFGIFFQKVEPRTISSACVHDYLYTQGRRYGLRMTDKIYRDSLIVSGYSRIGAYIQRFGLFLASWVVWYKIIKI